MKSGKARSQRLSIWIPAVAMVGALAAISEVEATPGVPIPPPVFFPSVGVVSGQAARVNVTCIGTWGIGTSPGRALGRRAPGSCQTEVRFIGSDGSVLHSEELEVAEGETASAEYDAPPCIGGSAGCIPITTLVRAEVRTTGGRGLGASAMPPLVSLEVFDADTGRTTVLEVWDFRSGRNTL